MYWEFEVKNSIVYLHFYNEESFICAVDKRFKFDHFENYVVSMS